jgi:Secretion system C-terminal sorting domain
MKYTRFLKNISKGVVLALLLTALSNVSFSQSFTNGGLEDTPGTGNIPSGWSAIAFTESNCVASDAPRATCDTRDAAAGLIPHGGLTCVSGGMGFSVFPAGLMFHEGIKQTVSGFTIGDDYTIAFFQAVVASFGTQDITGGWSVYKDNTLIGNSAITTSTTGYSTAVAWEIRSMTFTATSTSHTIRFLPYDDDANYTPMATGGNLTMAIDDIQIQNALPINLVSFDVEQKDDGNTALYWSTMSEINNDYFTVERSKYGINFDSIIRVEGSGNSNVLLHYSTLDTKSIQGTSYYRIKQTDFDGSFEYSDIKSINIIQNRTELYPNPAISDVTLFSKDWEPNEIVYIVVTDAFGRNYTKEQKAIKDGCIKIDLSDLEKGIYLVNTRTRSGANSVNRVVKL